MSLPVRSLQLSHRNLTGRVALRSGTSVTFESALERDWIILLDFDLSVEEILVQPFSIYHTQEGVRRRYTPDIRVVRRAANNELRICVYEVKPWAELKDKWNEYRARFVSANSYCRAKGWQFSIVTERDIRTPILENATFLRRYRTITDSALTSSQLLCNLRTLGISTPERLISATCETSDARMLGLSSLWKLIATGQIQADLHQPLTMRSTIRIAMN